MYLPIPLRPPCPCTIATTPRHSPHRSESWSTTSYMADQSSWNWAVRQGVRVAGALLMWQIGQRMPKKYNLQGE